MTCFEKNSLSHSYEWGFGLSIECKRVEILIYDRISEQVFSKEMGIRKGRIMSEPSQLQPEEPSTSLDLLEVDTDKLSSVALARLIEEVRNEEISTAHTYDRVHNRHNRGR